MNSTIFSRISNVSPSSSNPCFIHVAPTPTHAKLKTDIYSFPTLGHRPGSEKKEFGLSCNVYRNVWCRHRGQFEDRFRCTSCNAPGPLAHPRGPLRHHRFPFVFSNQTRPSRWSRRPPGMRRGPLGIPGARCATIVFQLVFSNQTRPSRWSR